MRLPLFLIKVFIALTTTNLAWATIIPESEYPFPIKDHYVSTISSAANTPLASYETLKIEVRKDRRNVPLLEKRNAVPLALFEHKNKKAPLAFIISGTGGTALSGSALLLASQLYLQGYHAVTLPDPISWHYVLGVSESALPGNPLRDAPEYYEFMKKVTSFLKKQQGLNFTDISVAGYSYGGLLSGFLAREDEKQKVFNFAKVIIINPPFNLKSSMMLLDNYFAEVKNITPERRSDIMGALVTVASQIQGEGFDLKLVAGAAQKLHLTHPECRWLIGESFRINLSEVIFASQQVKDLGFLKKKALPYRFNERMKEARQFGFREYFIRFLAPSLKPNRETPTREEMEIALNEANFTSLAETLKNNKNIFVLTNKDDFLVTPADIEFLENTMHERFVLYPYGGHMGNLWFPMNKANFERIMSLTQ